MTLTFRIARIILLFSCGGLSATPPMCAQSKKETALVKSMLSRASSERPILIDVLNSKDEKSLHALVAKKPLSSRIGQMIYATRLYQLNPQKGGVAILRSLPRSDIEMEALNEFSHQSNYPAFRPTYRAFYDSAFESVKVHPEFLHLVFRIAVEFDTKNWPDYDDIDWYCNKLAEVYKAIPKHYEHAVEAESANDAKLLSSCAHGH